MGADADLDEMARRVIDANLYMTLATLQPDGSPWLSPVYFTPARYRDVATATSCEVLIRAGHPEHGTGIDRRVPADPAR